MTTPPELIFVIDLSRFSKINSMPHIASSMVISFVINKSAPFLLKILCFYWATIITISPASFYGCSSASPWKKYFSPSGDPLSILHSITFLVFTIHLPTHALHLFASGIVSPVPLHTSH